jgi:hypothetical protein
MNNFEKAQISVELSRLIARQTEFFQKSDPTLSELQEFKWAGECIRKLFAELERIRKAA